MSAQPHVEAALMDELFEAALMNELLKEDPLTTDNESAAARYHVIGAVRFPPLSAAIMNREPTTPPSPPSTASSEKERSPGLGLALPRNPAAPTADHGEPGREQPLGYDPAPLPTPSPTPEHNRINPSQSPSKKRKRETPPEQQTAKVKLRCRHGCRVTFCDRASMRVHHHKVHNCFKEGTAKAWCRHCFKKFANFREYDQHLNADTVCSTTPLPSEWLFWRPTNRQDRADTWGYAADGPVSKYLEVDGDSDPSEWEELPQPAHSPPKAISINNQVKQAPDQRGPVDKEEILVETSPEDVNTPTAQDYSPDGASSAAIQHPNEFIDLTNDIQRKVAGGATRDPGNHIDLTDDVQRGAKRIRLGDDKNNAIAIDN